ncbi:unnamed protein product [Oncorhynchus mykiss]|uniref:Uncharacterized protein n=1 Tax=Oncorhynchus mykiss TaxID=8022 RepID=A0A060ZA35_ONCMY|nr:unnamed protein product [Oncorhynchus mykiss]
MPIQSFSFPLPETRFFQAGQHVYKFKIRGGNNCSEVKVMGEEFVNRELENTIRAVLANLDCLQPFTTPHFTVYPCILPCLDTSVSPDIHLAVVATTQFWGL